MTNIVVVLNNLNFECLGKFGIAQDVERIVKKQKFTANNSEILFIPEVNDYAVWLVGALDCDNFTKLGASVCKKLLGIEMDALQVVFAQSNNEQLHDFMEGMLLRNYVFDKYKKCEKKTLLAKTISTDCHDSVTEQIKSSVQSVHKARNFVNEAPCHLFPLAYAVHIADWLQPLGITVRILKGREIEKMGLLVGVGKASDYEPCVVIMEKIVDPLFETIALVGKGVTYDSGGLSLKPGHCMETMKSDMSGSAVVVGAMANIAKMNLKKNVVGIVGLVENMVAGNALRPDDVLTSFSGKTVEVNNTDAEGRLVLADLFSYVQANYKINYMIDFATLTGAMVVALGHVYAGLFANDDALANDLLSAGLRVHEPLWRMPLHKNYNAAMDCEIADMKNCASGSVGAGSSTAAMFLSRFVDDNVKWAHVDIAGVSFLPYEDFCSTVGATGFGIRMLIEFLL